MTHPTRGLGVVMYIAFSAQVRASDIQWISGSVGGMTRLSNGGVMPIISSYAIGLSVLFRLRVTKWLV